MLQIKLVCYVPNYTNWSTFVETTAKMKKTKVFLVCSVYVLEKQLPCSH